MEAVGRRSTRRRACPSSRSTARRPRVCARGASTSRTSRRSSSTSPTSGSRYYTYIWTMLLAMEACAGSRLRFVVCDRPNPIGGEVEGAPAVDGLPDLRRPAPDPGASRDDGRRARAPLRRGAPARPRSRRQPGGGLGARHDVRSRRACPGSRRRRTCRRPTPRSSIRACACSRARTSRRGAARRGRSRSSARRGSRASRSRTR